MKQITQILLEGESPTLRMFALLVKQILKQFFSRNSFFLFSARCTPRTKEKKTVSKSV